MYLSRLVNASVLFSLIGFPGTHFLQAQSDPASSTAREKEKVVVPSPDRPRGELKPPVLGTAPRPETPETVSVPQGAGETLTVVIPAGTGLPARMTEELKSGETPAGYRFEAVLDRDLTVNGEVVVPRGTELKGVVEEAEAGGRVSGRAFLTLALTELQLEGEEQALKSSQVTIEASSSKGKDARTVGTAAGIGAIVGAIFGGKKGAALGGAIGAGAGTGRVLTTRGKAAVVEREQLLTFRLEEDVEFQVRR